MLRLKIICPKHKRYDPAKEGEAAIRGGCVICTAMFKLWCEAVMVERMTHGQ